MSEQRTAWTHQPTAEGRRRVKHRRGVEQRQILATVPLFNEVPSRHIKRLADLSSVVEFAGGDEIVREGASGSVFYVISDGEAKVVRGNRTIAKLTAGDHFGELSILAGTPRSASVIAASTPTRCITLSAKALRTVLSDEPRIALRVLENVAKRLLDAERPPAG
jgi:CRP/FNR family transcriptional regulator, cyclic AMP receptor protein